jgi:hypothetical protein
MYQRIAATNTEFSHPAVQRSRPFHWQASVGPQRVTPHYAYPPYFRQKHPWVYEPTKLFPPKRPPVTHRYKLSSMPFALSPSFRSKLLPANSSRGFEDVSHSRVRIQPSRFYTLGKTDAPLTLTLRGHPLQTCHCASTTAPLMGFLTKTSRHHSSEDEPRPSASVTAL